MEESKRHPTITCSVRSGQEFRTGDIDIMSQSPFAWTPPQEIRWQQDTFSQRDSSPRHACNRLEPEWLDRTPAEGADDSAETLVHCNGLIQFASSKAIGEDMGAPRAQIDNADWQPK